VDAHARDGGCRIQPLAAIRPRHRPRADHDLPRLLAGNPASPTEFKI